jgi:hypothetical protein
MKRFGQPRKSESKAVLTPIAPKSFSRMSKSVSRKESKVMETLKLAELVQARQYFKDEPRTKRQLIKVPSSLRGLNNKNILADIASERNLNQNKLTRNVSLLSNAHGQFRKNEPTYLTQVQASFRNLQQDQSEDPTAPEPLVQVERPITPIEEMPDITVDRKLFIFEDGQHIDEETQCYRVDLN